LTFKSTTGGEMSALTWS